MSKESHWQYYVGCPFYHSDDESHRITCEGIVDGSSISQYFRSKKAFTTQIKTFCCQHYRNCELHGILLATYMEE